MGARHSAVVTLILVGWAATGCVTGPPPPVYEVRQSALVPAPAHAPPPAFEGLGDLYLGDATLIHLSEPELEPNANAGLYVPRTQVQAVAGIRVTPGFVLRLLYEHHPSGGELAAAPTTLESPGGFSFAAGLGAAGRVEVDGWHMRFGLDALMMQISTHRESRCIEHCTDARSGSRGGLTGVAGYGAWWTMHFVDHGMVHPWVGVTFRNQPTILGSFTTTDPGGTEPETGVVSLVSQLGAEILLTRGFRLVPHIQWPISASPIVYGPIVGIGMRGTLGDEPEHWHSDD